MAICSGCGAQIEDGVAFCPDCGKKQEQTAASTEQASTTTEQTNTTAQANTTEQTNTVEQTTNAAPEQAAGTAQGQTTNAAPEQAAGTAQGQSFATGAQQPGNGFAGNGQYNTQNQFGGQNQYGNQNQYGGQNQYGNQNQYGGYAGPQQGGYAAPEKKDKLAAGLLGLFLGTLGIHKFYLGYSKEGLIMLLTSLVGGIITCGIATFAIEIIALVEGVMYLTKSDEEFYQTYVVGHKGWF